MENITQNCDVLSMYRNYLICDIQPVFQNTWVYKMPLVYTALQLNNFTED